jgi:DNA-binding beta-propeller fold protein YncE
MMKLSKKFLLAVSVITFLYGCSYDKNEPVSSEVSYPKEVGTIILNKCATAGCHNTQSAGNAGGLDFSTWDKMFEGGFNGSSVIPYSVDYSFMLYFVNTYPDLGISLEPRMPYNQPRLSRDEVLTLRNWIAGGAPNADGFVKFSDDANRQKFYVCMQGCDQVAVFDAKSRVIMRYIKVGVSEIIESPHQVRITPDGKYWCVNFISGHVLQVFNTSDDALVASIEIGNATWNTITFSPDSKKAYVCATQINPQIVEVNLQTMSFSRQIPSSGFPHGSYVTQDGSTLYVTSQFGNHLTKIYLSDLSYDDVTIDGTFTPNNTGNSYDPHEIIFTPDESYYFVTCQYSNDVRMLRKSDDSLRAVIPVGSTPLEMAISETRPYLYVSCMEDSSVAGRKGKVYVINYQTGQVITSLYTGWQPHGLSVDDGRQLVYVTNRNVSTNGPAPHHTSGCGRNGYVTIIDIITNQMLRITLPDGFSYDYKNEVLADPYFIAYRK